MGELDQPIDAEFTYEVSEDPDGSPVVSLKGELDMTTSPKLEAAVASVIARSPSRLIIDATELEFADSSAIALLVRWRKLVGHVEVRQPPELLRRVIARMGLSDQLQMSP
jgi:anti-sigma B factor antagonist